MDIALKHISHPDRSNNTTRKCSKEMMKTACRIHLNAEVKGMEKSMLKSGNESHKNYNNRLT